MSEYGCPLWDENCDPLEVEGEWLGIYDGRSESVCVDLGDLEPIIVSQSLEAHNLKTSRYVWTAGVVLSRFFATCLRRTATLVPLRAVELGAGSGVCSAALARCLGVSCSVVATDFPSSLHLASDTASRNGLQHIITVEALDWSADPPLRADLVFGADLTYEDLAQTQLINLLRIACRNGATALLAHVHRGLREDFERALSDGLEEVSWGELCLESCTASADVSIYLIGDPLATLLVDGALSSVGALVMSWHNGEVKPETTNH